MKESFDGDAWVGLVPAQVPHYNESLNWQKHYARIWLRLGSYDKLLLSIKLDQATFNNPSKRF